MEKKPRVPTGKRRDIQCMYHLLRTQYNMEKQSVHKLVMVVLEEVCQNHSTWKDVVVVTFIQDVVWKGKLFGGDKTAFFPFFCRKNKAFLI